MSPLCPFEYVLSFTYDVSEQVGEAKFVFEARTIQRMELLVLSTLKWRMQAVTPFSFIDYYLHKLNDGNAPSKLSVSRAVELVLSITRGIYIYILLMKSSLAAKSGRMNCLAQNFHGLICCICRS